MELQRHLMLMYTSCGWFFDELSGIETVQNIKYAGRVLQLATSFLATPSNLAFSNILNWPRATSLNTVTARNVYEKFVRPVMLDMKDVGAHYALSSLFQDIGERSSIYAYSPPGGLPSSFQVGGSRLVIGRATVTSEVTRVSSSCAWRSTSW